MPTPRPKWNDPEVQAAAIKAHIHAATVWAQASTNIDLSSEENQHQFLAIVTLAVQESADAYTAGRYLETHMGWPVDSELVRVLDRAYADMPRRVDPFIHAWVMKERVRFPAKQADFVKFCVGPVTMQGTVSAVISREARAIVEVKTAPGVTKNMSVNAEDVISHSKGLTKPSGGGTPPTGGTPVAPRSGAILREAKAA